MIFDYSSYFSKHVSCGVFKEFDLCRISSMVTQDGKCYVSGLPLTRNNRELHHRQPRFYDGADTQDNLIYVCKDIHVMIHTFSYRTFVNLLFKLNLSHDEVAFVNQLRAEAHRIQFRYPTKNIA